MELLLTYTGRCFFSIHKHKLKLQQNQTNPFSISTFHLHSRLTYSVSQTKRSLHYLTCTTIISSKVCLQPKALLHLRPSPLACDASHTKRSLHHLKSFTCLCSYSVTQSEAAIKIKLTPPPCRPSSLSMWCITNRALPSLPHELGLPITSTSIISVYFLVT